MFPLRFLLGVATGAVAILLMNPNVTNRARPVAKSALKKAMKAMHGAQVAGAEFAEAAEDLYAEAKMEATAEVFAEAMAAAQAKSPNGATQAKPAEAAAKPAGRRIPRKRAKPAASADA